MAVCEASVAFTAGALRCVEHDSFAASAVGPVVQQLHVAAVTPWIGPSRSLLHNKRTWFVTRLVTGLWPVMGYKVHYKACYKGRVLVIITRVGTNAVKTL